MACGSAWLYSLPCHGRHQMGSNPIQVAKMKKKRKKKQKQQKHSGTIMTKAKVHKNEDLKLYDRKRVKKEKKKEIEDI